MSANSLLKGCNSRPLVQQRPSFVNCVIECIPIGRRVVGNTGRLEDKKETKPQSGLVSSAALPHSLNPASRGLCQHSRVLRCSRFCYEKLITSAFQIHRRGDQKDKNERISILNHPTALILQWILFRKTVLWGKVRVISQISLQQHNLQTMAEWLSNKLHPDTALSFCSRCTLKARNLYLANSKSV